MPRSRVRRCTASATLPRKSAAIPLPSMIFAVMACRRIRLVASGSPDGRTQHQVSAATALPHHADFLQRGGKRSAGAADPQLLEPRARARNQAHVAHGDAEGPGDELDKRRIGLALACRRAHARLEHAAPVGKLRDAVDGIAATPWCEPDDEQKAARLDAPGRRRTAAEDTEVKPDDELVEKEQSNN